MAKDWTANLHPELVRRVKATMATMEAKGKPMAVVSAFRSEASQLALYAQGRTKPGPIVTGLRLGTHNLGLAVDMAFRVGKGISWDKPEAWWQEYGEAAEDAGLVWGGRWQGFTDRPHVQLIPVSAQKVAMAIWIKERSLASVWKAVAPAIKAAPVSPPAPPARVRIEIPGREAATAPVTLMDGRSYVAVADLAQALGLPVGWDAEAKTATVG